jgi:hypothetical protein
MRCREAGRMLFGESGSKGEGILLIPHPLAMLGGFGMTMGEVGFNRFLAALGMTIGRLE